MKRTLILSVLVIFTLALFAPAIVNAMDNSVFIVNVNGDEKKTEKKADEKKAPSTEAKACTGEKKAETKACCAEKKACTGEKKAECTGEKKAEKK